MVKQKNQRKKIGRQVGGTEPAQPAIQPAAQLPDARKGTPLSLSDGVAPPVSSSF
jgi:hypothetical protein